MSAKACCKFNYSHIIKHLIKKINMFIDVNVRTAMVLWSTHICTLYQQVSKSKCFFSVNPNLFIICLHNPIIIIAYGIMKKKIMSCNPTTCKYRTTKLAAKTVGGVQITTREWDEYRNYSHSGREQRGTVCFSGFSKLSKQTNNTFNSSYLKHKDFLF